MERVDLTELKTDREALIREIEETGRPIRNPKSFPCPFHDDHAPSATVYEGADGYWRFKCHAASCGFSGDVFDVRARIKGQPVEEILKDFAGRRITMRNTEQKPERIFASIKEIEDYARRRGKHEGTHIYSNPVTRKPDLIVLRMRITEGVSAGKKDFSQFHAVEGGYAFGGVKGPQPLYNRLAICDSDAVIVVEGEKCVERLRRVGFVGTTAPGGAGPGKAGHTDWTLLAGKKLFLWPDNDPGGIGYMKDVFEIVSHLSPKCEIYRVDPGKLGLKEKGDVADLIDDGAGEDEILGILDSAELTTPGTEFKKYLNSIIDGSYASLPFPWPEFTKKTQALLPGSVMILCGDPGATKSFFLLEALTYWHDRNIKCCVFELESSREFHLQRALAQRANCADMTQTEWVRNNPDQVLEAEKTHKAFLDSFRDVITADHPKAMTMADLATWVEERAKENYRIIAIDPITLGQKGKFGYQDDAAFMERAKRVIRDYGASLILVTHPTKARMNPTPSMNDLSGGAIYQQMSETIIWIEYHLSKTFQVQCGYGLRPIETNRTLHILKARNGTGSMFRMAFKFSTDNLCSEELGTIVKNG